MQRIFLSFCVALLATFLAPLTFAATIRLWHSQRGDEEKALEEVVAQFKDARVELLAVPSDAFKSKVTSAVQFGEGPDLFIDAHNRIGHYVRSNVISPVGDALDTPAFVGPPLDAVMVDDKAYGVPLSQKSVALYINTDLVTDVPTAFEGIANLRGKLPPGVFPLAYEASGLYMHAAILHAFGGKVLLPGDQFGVVGAEAEKSLEFVLGLQSQKVIPEEADGALVSNLFRSGKAACAISGPWLATDLAGATSLHYRVVPIPLIRQTGKYPAPLLTVELVMLTPRGAERAEVRALARLLGSVEASRIRAERAKTLPARNDAPLPAGDAFLAAFAEQAKRAVPMSSSLAMDVVWEPAIKAIRKVLRRDALAETALSEAKRRFDDVRRPLPPRASKIPLIVLVGLLCLFGAFALVRRAREDAFRSELRRSLPAYAYVLHAVAAIGILVLLPLFLGALTSLFAGRIENLHFVGLSNFIDILTARGGPLLGSGSFYVVLLVTVLWTVINVFFHVAIGVALALVLSRPVMKLKAVYRVLLIIPWAVPSYVTALAWKGMFHRQFGAMTGLVHALNDLFGTNLEPIAWFSRFSTAFAANVATNVWLGFPFMMVVTLGALTAVPDDVLEAAKVDGATRWQRLRLVTLPMIKPSLMPAVTMGAVWTFNMFNVVFLVSGGDPDGTTEILVSEAYRWAFTRDAQYGYAAAYAVLIFLLLFGTTRVTEAWKSWREGREKQALANAGGAA